MAKKRDYIKEASNPKYVFVLSDLEVVGVYTSLERAKHGAQARSKSKLRWIQKTEFWWRTTSSWDIERFWLDRDWIRRKSIESVIREGGRRKDEGDQDR